MQSASTASTASSRQWAGRWAFDEFTDVHAMPHDFIEKIEVEFDKRITAVGVKA